MCKLVRDLHFSHLACLSDNILSSFDSSLWKSRFRCRPSGSLNETLHVMALSFDPNIHNLMRTKATLTKQEAP